MSNTTYKPFGTVISGTTEETIDFSVDAGFKYKDKNAEDMRDIFNSAVGDFTERPLQIMIREIAKNFLIFTPIGWIVLLFIVCRKYKCKLNYLFANMKRATNDVMDSIFE